MAKNPQISQAARRRAPVVLRPRAAHDRAARRRRRRGHRPRRRPLSAMTARPRRTWRRLRRAPSSRPSPRPSRRRPSRRASAPAPPRREASADAYKPMSAALRAAFDAWLMGAYAKCWRAPKTLPDGDPYLPKVRVAFTRGRRARRAAQARQSAVRPGLAAACRRGAESGARLRPAPRSRQIRRLLPLVEIEDGLFRPDAELGTTRHAHENLDCRPRRWGLSWLRAAPARRRQRRLRARRRASSNR